MKKGPCFLTKNVQQHMHCHYTQKEERQDNEDSRCH